MNRKKNVPSQCFKKKKPLTLNSIESLLISNSIPCCANQLNTGIITWTVKFYYSDLSDKSYTFFNIKLWLSWGNLNRKLSFYKAHKGLDSPPCPKGLKATDGRYKLSLWHKVLQRLRVNGESHLGKPLSTMALPPFLCPGVQFFLYATLHLHRGIFFSGSLWLLYISFVYKWHKINLTDQRMWAIAIALVAVFFCSEYILDFPCPHLWDELYLNICAGQLLYFDISLLLVLNSCSEFFFSLFFANFASLNEANCLK